MDPLLINHGVDFTGRNPDNLISDEEQLIVSHSGITESVIVPILGGFYTDGLILRDEQGNRLRESADYIAVYKYQDVSDYTKLEVCGAIIIVNNDLTGSVFITYQAVGGAYVYNPNAQEEVIQYLRDNPDTVIQWGDIEGTPSEYGPDITEYERWERFSFEYFNRRLEELTLVLMAGDQEAVSEVWDYVRGRYAAAEGENDQLLTILDEHMDDQDDPHDLTAEQIQMQNVVNQPMASVAIDIAGTSHAHYSTPRGVAEALATNFTQPFDAHVSDLDDPHEVTPDQVDSYSTAVQDAQLATKLDTDETAVNANRLTNGAGSISYIGFYGNVRRQLPAGLFTQGRVAPARLGQGTANANTLLRGDGRFVPIADIVKEYGQSTKIVFIAPKADVSTALSHIRSTFTSLTTYPVGTIVVYRVTTRTSGSTANGTVRYDTYYMRGAIRTPSGWSGL